MPSNPTTDKEQLITWLQDHCDEIVDATLTKGSRGQPLPAVTVNWDVIASAWLEDRKRAEREAVEAAVVADPLKCEFGHEVIAHRTADGWCCACPADIARLSEITGTAELPPPHPEREYKEG